MIFALILPFLNKSLFFSTNQDRTLLMSNRKENSRIKVLVVGGSSDIGEKIIEALSDDIYDITYTYNSRQKSHLHANAIKACLDNKSGLTDFLKEIKDTLFNIVIYCPGSNPTMLAKDINLDVLEENSWLNYLSPVSIINCAVNNMLKEKNINNKIIYISSVSANKARIGNGLYGSNKIATERYLSSLALEVGRFGIRTTAIAPAYIESSMLNDICKRSGITLNDIKKRTVTKSILNPDDVKNAVMAFINNQIISTGGVISINNGENI